MPVGSRSSAKLPLPRSSDSTVPRRWWRTAAPPSSPRTLPDQPPRGGACRAASTFSVPSKVVAAMSPSVSASSGSPLADRLARSPPAPASALPHRCASSPRRQSWPMRQDVALTRQVDRCLERQLQLLVIDDIERGQMQLPLAIVKAAGAARVGIEAGSAQVQAGAVRRRGALRFQRDAVHGAAAPAQAVEAQQRIDAPAAGRIQVDAGAQGFEPQVVPGDAGSARDQRQDRIVRRAADVAAGRDAAAGVRQQQREVVGIDVELQVEARPGATGELDARRSEAQTHVVEAPAVDERGEPGMAAGALATELAAKVIEPHLNRAAGEALAFESQAEVEAAAYSGPQACHVELLHAAACRPGLFGRPAYVGGELRLAAEQIHARLVHLQPIAVQQAVRDEGRCRPLQRCEVAARVERERPQALEAEGSRGIVHRRSRPRPAASAGRSTRRPARASGRVRRCRHRRACAASSRWRRDAAAGARHAARARHRCRRNRHRAHRHAGRAPSGCRGHRSRRDRHAHRVPR